MPTEEFVTVFADRNFQGGSQKLQPGSYNLDYGPVGDNNISSIAIPDGWTVVVYADLDCQGEAKTFSASAAELGDFDDRISSIVISNASSIPVGPLPSQAPQLVFLAFDDALTTLHYDEFSKPVLLKKDSNE